MKQYNIKQIFNFIKLSDIGHLFLCIFITPIALIAKIFIRNFWLICEDRNEARDNGYWFFKWIRENHKEQKVAYAINKKSPDYDKVRNLGKIVGYGTPAHWFWYIVADRNISSQKGGKPNAAVCYFFEVILKLRKNNRIFLQHGVTINKGNWLYYRNTNIRLFITAALPEHKFILEEFGYPENNVKLCGFARFDSLHDISIDHDLILVMPTWRNWLGRYSHGDKIDFCDTQYFKKWSEFINDSRLNRALKIYNKKLIFFPHRNMQKFLTYFKTDSDRIEIADWKKYDIQEVLKKAGFMITDYSSVFFDFAYMRKPVAFYQFDEAEFRAKQYAEGYFDYHNTVLGRWTDNLDGLMDIIEQNISHPYSLLDTSVIREFFPVWDDRNCQRIYDEINNIASL